MTTIQPRGIQTHDSERVRLANYLARRSFTRHAQCKAWLDAGDPSYVVTTTGTNLVTTLVDKVGGNNAVASGTARPTLVDPQLESPNFLCFDGDTDDLTWVQLSNVMRNDQYTVCVAFRVRDIATDDPDPWVNDAVFADEEGRVGIHLKDSGSLVQCYHWDGDNDAMQTWSLTANTWSIATIAHDGLAFFAAKDAAGLGSLGAQPLGATADDSVLHLGRRGGKYAEIDFGEVITFDAKLSDTDRWPVVDYLAWKWGVG